MQFHVMEAIPVDHFSYVNIEDFYRPRGSIGTIENAQGSKTPVSFIIQYQSVGSLPKQIDIDQNLLGGALKKGAVYTVIVEAFYVKRVRMIWCLIRMKTAAHLSKRSLSFAAKPDFVFAQRTL